MTLIATLQSSPLPNEKSQFSVEIVVQTVPAAQREIGVTKMYDLALTNKTRATLFVNQCEGTDDTLHKLLVTPYALQRWNQETKRWDTIAGHLPDYCRGDRFHQARQIRTAVAPGQKLEVNGDFVGAIEAFSFGDRGRFIVFLHAPGDYDDIAISPEFQIDEHRNKPAKSTQ